MTDQHTINRVGGAWAAFLYNSLLGKVPSHTLRRLYLRWYLAEMGRQSHVQMGCRFLHGRNIHLADNVVLNFGTLLDGRRYPITVGTNVSIGPCASLLTLGHDPQSPEFADAGGPILIEEYAWLAYGCLVLPGVTIGKGAVIAAGAVVTRDVAPFAIMAGNPAKPVGKRQEALAYRLDYNPFLL